MLMCFTPFFFLKCQKQQKHKFLLQMKTLFSNTLKQEQLNDAPNLNTQKSEIQDCLELFVLWCIVLEIQVSILQDVINSTEKQHICVYIQVQL